MRGRLCFCTAINLDPDVLLLDEIFSVGDQTFRAQSEKMMLARFRENKAIVYVSHSVAMLRRLCDKAIWLDAGRIRAAGEVEPVIAEYQCAARKRQNNPTS